MGKSLSRKKDGFCATDTKRKLRGLERFAAVMCLWGKGLGLRGLGEGLGL